MRRLRVDFSARAEDDTLLVPLPFLKGSTVKNERVVLFDEDLEVVAVICKRRYHKRHIFEIRWDTVKVSGWRAPPPKEVQDYITANPMPLGKPLPMDE